MLGGDFRARLAGLSLPAALTYTGKTITGGSFAGGAFTGAAWDNGAIGGTTPAAGSFTALKATQTLNIGGVITPAQITSDQNNYSPTGFATATVLRLDTNASRSITGIAARDDGDVIIVQNIGASDLKLLNESASSTAANRLAIFADATLNPNTSAALRYDATSQRWRSVSGAGSGGGGGSGVSQVIIAAGTGINVSGTCTITSIGTCTINLTTPVSAANGGTGVSSPTANTVPINQGGSAQTNTGVGAAGTCLTGTGGAPAFVAGCRKLLATYTPSAVANIDQPTFFTSNAGYNEYEFVFERVLPAQAGGVALQLQVYIGGSLVTSGYSSYAIGTGAAGFAPTTYIPIARNGGVLNTGGGVSGKLTAYNPAGGLTQWVGLAGVPNSSTVQDVGMMGGAAWNGGANQGFRISFSGGNIASGIIRIYGVN